MKNKKIISLVISLLVLGFSVATIYFMGEAKKQEAHTQALWDAQKRMQENHEALQTKVLSSPDSCIGIKADIFSTVCGNEVYETETVIPWATGINNSAASCLADSYLSKMELFAQKNGRSFDKSNYSDDWKFILHACEVSADFSLFIDDFNLEDEGVDASKALDLWYHYDADKYCRKSKEHSWCN